MYNVNVNGVNVNASSYAAASRVVTEAAASLAATLAASASKPAPTKLYRSPVVAASVRSVQAAQARNVAAAKVPAKAGSYTGKNGPLRWSIAKA